MRTRSVADTKIVLKELAKAEGVYPNVLCQSDLVEIEKAAKTICVKSVRIILIVTTERL